MKKNFKSYKHQGLPGGANEVKSFTEGFIVSSEGQYKYPGMNTMIPNANGRITMNKVGYPVLGIDDLGNSIMMQPGGEYQFPGNDVYEIPMAQDGLFLRAGKFRPQTSTIGSTLGFKKVFPKRETTWSLTGDLGYGKNLETDKEGLAASINAENFGKFFGGQRRFNAITNLEAFVEPGNYGGQFFAGPNFHWGTHPKRNLPRGTGRVDFQPFNMRVGYQSTPWVADSGDVLFEGTGGKINYGLGARLKGEYALPKKGALRGSKMNPVLFGDVGVDFDFLKSNYDEEGVARGSIYGMPTGFTINPSFAANVGIRLPIDGINLGRRRKSSLVEDDPYYNPGIRVSDPEAVEAYEEPDEYQDGGTYTVKSGDTFNAIAYANGISPEQLAALNPGINIDAISIGQVLALPEMEEVVQTPSAIDNMYLKQAFAESSFRPKVIRGEIDSPVGALGLVQLMPETIKEMKKLNLVSKDFDPLDPKQAVEGQKAYMNWISERPYLNKGEDFVKEAKFLGAYNTGVGNIKSALTKAKAAGVDIYNTLDWVDTKYLPEETVDYINRIIGQDEQFNTDFNKAVSDTTNKYILDLYTTGGSVLTNWNLEQQNKWKGLTETDDEGASIIKGYNDIIGTTYNPSDAWSAITISNAAMAHMGASTGDEARSLGFRPSKSHSGFVRDAFKATSDPTYEFNRYYAQPLNKSGYKIGDILVKGREETKNWKYDDFANAKAGYRSHSDIVVDRGEDEKGEYVILAGGNISNTYKNEKVYTSNLGKKGYKVQLSDQEEGIKMPEESDEADVKEVVKIVEKKPEPTFRDFLNEDDYKTVQQQQEVQQPQPVTIKPVGDPFAIFSAAQASNMPLMQDVNQRMAAAQSFAEDGGFVLDLDETEAQAYAKNGYIVEEMKEGGSSKPCPPGKIYDENTEECVSYEDWEYYNENMLSENFTIDDVKKLNEEYAENIDWYEQYHKSPMYKKMVRNSFPKGLKGKLSAMRINKLRNKNLENIPPVIITNQEEEEEEDAGGFSISRSGQIILYPDALDTGTNAHEISHSTDRPKDISKDKTRIMPSSDIQYTEQKLADNITDTKNYEEDPDYWNFLKDFDIDGYKKQEKEILDDLNYIGRDTEVRARLNTFRKLAQDRGIYDPFTEKVTPELYESEIKNFKLIDDSRKEGYNPIPQLQQIYSDEEIMWMLNNISKNEETSNVLDDQYAKHGGYIIDLDEEEALKYAQMGYIVEEIN